MPRDNRRSPDGYKPTVGGAVGAVTDGANVGVPPGTGEVFRDKTGTILNFRTLVGVNGATVTTVGDNVEIDGGGATAPVQSASFADNTTLELVVGALATDGQIVVDMSCFNTVSGDQQSIQWVFGVSPFAAAADIVEVPADGVTLLDINFIGLSVGPNVVARLQGIGAGDLIEVRYRVTNIPRL